MSNRAKNWSIGLAAVVWLVAIAAVFGAIEIVAQRRPAEGESGSTTSPELFRGKLIVFAHPHCPCFATTLDVFADVVERCSMRGRAEVIFVRPEGAPQGWNLGRSWDVASNLPGVRLRCDDGGVLAHQLGATTSGEVFLFDEQGGCLFHGGVTRPGSHAGDNPGRRSLLAAHAGEKPETRHNPTYGCPLE